VNRRLLFDVAKYLLAVILLVWVIRANWAPSPTKAVASLGASTVGLCFAPQGAGPLLAASAAFPGRSEPRGIGYVWQQHVVQRQPIAFGVLALGFTLYSAAVFLTLIRWYLLVRALDLVISFRDALRYGWIGIFFNTFLPGSVGGDIVKAAALASTQSRRTASVATVVMDRLIALWALVWFVALIGGVAWLAGGLVGPAGVASRTVVSIALTILACTASVWVLMGWLPERLAEGLAALLTRLPLVGGPLGEFWRAVWMYRQRQLFVALSIVLTWVGQVGFVSSFYYCAYALWTPELGPVPTFVEHFLLVPIGFVMQALVPTPGGAGAGEWGFAALYVLFHAAEANGVLASLVQRMFAWVMGLVGYIFYLSVRASKQFATEPTGQPASDSATWPAETIASTEPVA
jgi:uncharacterized membrane protein YbhN (UPF0104 family)